MRPWLRREAAHGRSLKTEERESDVIPRGRVRVGRAGHPEGIEGGPASAGLKTSRITSVQLGSGQL